MAMENLRNEKDEKEKVKEGKEKEEKKKPGFVAKAVLAAGLMIAAAAGCEETNNYNYYCPDVQTQEDVADVQEEDVGIEADALVEVTDVTEDAEEDVSEEGVVEIVEEDINEEDVEEEEVECVADLTPVTCDSSEPVVEGVMTLDEPLEAGNISFELQGTEEHAEGARAIVAAVDECDEILSMNAISEGQTLEFNIEGAIYNVTINTIHVSEENPWTDASVTINCDSMCETAGGIINQGEALDFGSFRLVLDDIDVASVPGEPAAIFDILDGTTSDILYSLRIPKGDYDYVFGYKIEVKEVAAGYTFGSKWAEVKISEPCD